MSGLMITWASNFLSGGDNACFVESPAYIFGIYIAFVFFREKITKLIFICSITGILGLILVAQPTFLFHSSKNQLPLLPVLTCILAGLLFLLVDVCVTIALVQMSVLEFIIASNLWMVFFSALALATSILLVCLYYLYTFFQLTHEYFGINNINIFRLVMEEYRRRTRWIGQQISNT